MAGVKSNAFPPLPLQCSLSMKASRSPLLLLCSCAVAVFPLSAQDSIRGFSAKDAAAEKRIEEQARAIPDAMRLRTDMEFMAALPHHAGSPRDKVVAEWILAQLKQWGLDAHFEEFEPLLPYPTIRE